MEPNDIPNHPAESAAPADRRCDFKPDSLGRTPWNFQLDGLLFRDPELENSFNKCLEQYRELYKWKLAARVCSAALAGTDISTAENFCRTQVNGIVRLLNRIVEKDREIANRDLKIEELKGRVDELRAQLEKLQGDFNEFSE